jgi:phage FluMu protein Com
MTDEELVKHCMCGCMYLEAECPNCNKVTDADRIEELEAKLAKAVEGLDKAAALIEDRHVVHMTSKGRNPKDYISDWSLIAKEVRALLAEIEGEKG